MTPPSNSGVYERIFKKLLSNERLTVKTRYNATLYYANCMITPRLFPSLSLLKEPHFSANFGLRKLTITPVFADHQLFSLKLVQLRQFVCGENRKKIK